MAEADNYPDIRLFTVQDVFSAEPLYELKAVQQPWSRASKGKQKERSLDAVFVCRK
ncbi:hypothetical protein DPMN_013030 [Dreissena polymorpha]|uniref:Uncharacterized protein n=1 Tax=Dreissena polymorpha TaxID=45954 RepID=A0A9D4N849_DREPO|nr:hypothetical protein DPMN_013030 [Dreissena polymorpha]